MKVLFRADASQQIGSGHVMRCLTLAGELKQRGADVTFVCREQPGNLIGLIEGKGYPVIKLAGYSACYSARVDDVAHATLLGVPWEQDAENTLAAIGEGCPDWLVVDHYALDCRWELILRPRVGRIMVIDDLADRPHDCDLLLDQNLYHDMASRYETLVPESCRRLLGPRYALLRPEFSVARKNLRQRDGVVHRVLVFFGGVDATNETVKALQALAGIEDRHFDVDAVVGAANPHREEVKALCAANDGFKYHCQIDNMAALMAAADLAIGAGGSTTWERCAVGLPSLVVSLADNQVPVAAGGAEEGILFLLGNTRTVSIEIIAAAVRTFRASSNNLKAYGRRCLETVDARGVHRVATAVMPPPIVMRQAVAGDCDAILEWRNAEETRKHIFDPEPIPLEVHRQWFHKSLDNPDRIILVGEIGHEPVGVVRYDVSGNAALISVYLVPGVHGQGAGTELIRCGTRWLRENSPTVKVINAEILTANSASKRAFEQAGYHEHHVTYQEVLS